MKSTEDLVERGIEGFEQLNISGENKTLQMLNSETKIPEKQSENKHTENNSDTAKVKSNLSVKTKTSNGASGTSVWSVLSPAHLHPPSDACGTLKQRHVNQIFIRGDSVVSVAIVYY